MKSTNRQKILFTLLTVLLAGSGFYGVLADTNPVSSSVLLKPTMEQRYATNLATRFLTNWHYKKTKLNDELSRQVYGKYIEMLDPNRSYFMAADMDYLEQFKNGLDDALSHAEVSPAFHIFNVYVDRVKERVAYAREMLKGDFDFSVDEEFRFDRSEADWASSERDINEIWRKRVKNDYLRLLLAKKEPEKITELLDERYSNLERRILELKGEDVFQFFMNSVTQAVEPHTSYLSPRTSENFEISMKLSLEGIGALLARQTEYTSIARIVPGGPAEMDGKLRIGDRIVSVGQGDRGKMTDVVGWRLDDVVDLIRGPKDSVVRLEVLPADTGDEGLTEVIALVRNEVKLEEQAASSSVIEVPKGEDMVKIGVITLPVFYLDFNGRALNKEDYRSSTRDVRRLIGELEQQGVAGLVIDLRNNGGGSLLEATTLTGLFIDKGPVVQVKDTHGRVSMERDDDPGMAWEGPMAVLVNRHSASASEIFAAAIQDYGRGVVVGETTFGKGTVQNLISLDDYAPADTERMGELKLTMAQFFRINGGSTQNKGVVPDIAFPSVGSADEWGESAMDNALPWTQIDPANYKPVGDLSSLLEVIGTRHSSRVSQDQEFAWLLADIKDFNSRSDKTTVSLLESARREEMESSEAKRKDRKRQRAILRGEEVPLDEPANPVLATEDLAADAAAAVAADTTATDEEGQEDEEPPFDVLLNEAARVLSDIVELNNNRNLLAQELKSLREAGPLNQ